MSRWLLIVVFALLGRNAAAETDAQLWLSANARYKPISKMRLELTQHLRFNENVTRVESVMPELEVQYRPFKPLAVKIGYRYIQERTKNGDFEPAHRYHVQLSTKKKFGPIEIGYRLRYQEKHEPDEFDYTMRLRNKISAEWDTDTDYTPMIFTEIFSDPKAIPVDSSKYRLGLGLEYKVNKKNRVSIDYLYQHDFEENDLQQHICRVNYQYKIKKPKPAKE